MEKEILYPVTEIFHSLQMEGNNAFRNSHFVRLAGCNLDCKITVGDKIFSCDEPLHDLAGASTRMTPEEIATKLNVPSDCIIITGGEPALYNLDNLIATLNETTKSWPVMRVHPASGLVGTGALIAIETNGTLPVSELLDYICVSPKPLSYAKGGKKIEYNLDTLERADEIKLVVGWTSVEEIEEQVDYFSTINPCAQIFLSPLTAFPGNTLIPEFTEKAVELVKRMPGVKLSMQVHKWLGIR